MRRKIGARLGWCEDCVCDHEKERRRHMKVQGLKPILSLATRLAKFRARKERARFVAKGAPEIKRMYIYTLIGSRAERLDNEMRPSLI
jgi:hypothetical protein